MDGASHFAGPSANLAFDATYIISVPRHAENIESGSTTGHLIHTASDCGKISDWRR
jgi:hypothetical protein